MPKRRPRSPRCASWSQDMRRLLALADKIEKSLAEIQKVLK
jgi:hypothetical protein